MLVPGTSFEARLLSPPLTPKTAKEVLEQIGARAHVGPVKLRTGVRTRLGGRGLDEWLVRFTWLRGVAPAQTNLGPFLIEGIIPRSAP
jgi:hypothetical protein